MKTTMRSLTALLLALLICMFTFVACGENSDAKSSDAKELTEDQIKTKLTGSDGEMEGTLTVTAGDSIDVEGFTYTVTDVNAEELNNKSLLKDVIDTLLADPYDLTYRELKMATAFNATANVVGIFYENTENFDSEAYTNEIISMICDGTSKTCAGWTITATINQAADSITVKAIKN